jgi:hypothetical protein
MNANPGKLTRARRGAEKKRAARVSRPCVGSTQAATYIGQELENGAVVAQGDYRLAHNFA